MRTQSRPPACGGTLHAAVAAGEQFATLDAPDTRRRRNHTARRGDVAALTRALREQLPLDRGAPSPAASAVPHRGAHLGQRPAEASCAVNTPSIERRRSCSYRRRSGSPERGDTLHHLRLHCLPTVTYLPRDGPAEAYARSGAIVPLRITLARSHDARPAITSSSPTPCMGRRTLLRNQPNSSASR